MGIDWLCHNWDDATIIFFQFHFIWNVQMRQIIKKESRLVVEEWGGEVRGVRKCVLTGKNVLKLL